VDLTGLDEHRLLLRALQEAADHLTLGLVVLRVTEPERVLYVNEGAATIFGRPRAELEGASPFILFAPELVDKERERIAARGRGAAPPIVFETVINRPDGTRVPLELAVSRVVTPGDTLTVSFIRDISARLEAVATLRRSEERFRSVVEGAPDGVVILQRGRIAFLNELAATLFGLPNREAGLGTLVTEHLVPEDAAVAADRIGRMIASGASFDPMEYRPRANPERIVEIKSILIEREGEPAVLAFARDVSARKRIEQELVRADRLASIGMMSAAVAHEINNPLAYAQLCLQFLERELPGLLGDKREWAIEQLRNASHGIDRVATIVRDLRSFARPDSGEVGRVDVIACIEQAIKLVDNEVRHRAQLVREFHDVPAVHANGSRLEQVFVNVLVNAAHAIPAGDVSNHEIRVTVRSRDNTIAVAVRDSGPGVPPELRDRVFEPFFSTKAVGVGTGLGLAVCRSIVEQLGGRIELDSAGERGGAVVTITLPVHRGEPVSAPAPTVVEPAAPRRLRVLVVDDEPLVRRALANILGRHHEVSLAEHGRQALEQIAADRIDVVVCDMMMPVMNGKELYEHLLAHEPALARRFVFITGGSFGAAATFLEETRVEILYKPFDLAKVLALVAAAAER
jgi:PAS domain S-box-containing protein